MLTAGTQFEAELKKRIDEELLRIAQILCEGTAVKDYAEYRWYVGKFQAFKQVSESFCDEVNTTLNKR